MNIEMETIFTGTEKNVPLDKDQSDKDESESEDEEEIKPKTEFSEILDIKEANHSLRRRIKDVFARWVPFTLTNLITFLIEL